MNQLTRRDFLKLCGTSSFGLALVACGVTPTPTATPAPTGTPFPTNTSLPTATPTLTNTLAPTSTATSTATMTATATPRPPTLRDFAEKITVGDEIFRIGTTVSYGDKDHNNPMYLQTAKGEFNLIVPAGQYAPEYIDKFGGAKFYTDYAYQNGLKLRIEAIFGTPIDLPFPPLPDDATTSQVEEWMKQRIRKILSYVRKGFKPQLVLANEPFWQYRGTIGWRGDRYTQKSSPFYGAFGEKWIAKSYVMLYKIARDEFDLTLGKDLEIIGINEAQVEVPTALADFLIQQVNQIRKDVSAELGIPLTQVQFDLGLEHHLGKGITNVRTAFPLSQIDKQILIKHYQRIRNETGAYIHDTEIDGIEDETALAQAYGVITEAAIESGVVKDMNFWANPSFNPPDSPWQNRLILPDYKKGIMYAAVADALKKYVSPK